MAIIAFGRLPKNSFKLTVAGKGVEDPNNVSLKIPTDSVIGMTGGAMALQLIRSMRFELSQ